jgi:hypothetical protein
MKYEEVVRGLQRRSEFTKLRTLGEPHRILKFQIYRING